MSGKARKLIGRRDLKLQRKRQVILYIRIRKVTDIAVRLRSAQPVEKHDLRRRLSLDLRRQMGSFRHSVPVKVDDDLNTWILRQDLLDLRFCQFICHTPVKLTVHQVIDTLVVDSLDPVCIVQKLRKIRSHPQDRRAGIPRHGIDKSFLGMRVVDQHLRPL